MDKKHIEALEDLHTRSIGSVIHAEEAQKQAEKELIRAENHFAKATKAASEARTVMDALAAAISAAKRDGEPKEALRQ